MKIHAMTLAATTLATNIFLALPAHADTAALPAQEVQGSVSFVSGGVGEDEATTFKRAAAGFPLELVFVQKATPRDEYLADVKVTIRDRTGAVLLDAVSDGPFLLAKLASGNYKIEADYGGVAKHHTVNISDGKHQRAVFAWTSPDDTKSAMSSNRIDTSKYQ